MIIIHMKLKWIIILIVILIVFIIIILIIIIIIVLQVVLKKYPKLIDRECIKNTEIKITTEEVAEYYDTIFTKENYNVSNLDNDKDKLIETEKMAIIFTTTQNKNKETEIKSKEEEIEYYNI